MASKELKKSVAVLGVSLYIDGRLCARDTKFTAPNIAYKTASINQSGDYEVPLVGNTENMELKVTLTGHDAGQTGAGSPKWHDVECREVLQIHNTDGSTTVSQVKHKAKCFPKEVSNGEGEVGSNIEREITYNVQRYQQYVDGKEQILIDKIQHIQRFSGIDYAPSIENLL